jgi:hypothetical protein
VIVDRLPVEFRDVEATIMAAVRAWGRRPASGSVFDRADLMRDLTARKTAQPARSHRPATMTESIV